MTMMSCSEVGTDLAKVLQQAHRGDPAAWEAIFRECYPKVRRVVRRKLNRSMRSLYDSTDFASDVMKSLAANIGRLHFPSIDSLLAFLAQVAEQKVIDEYRRHHTLKRDIARDRPILSGDEETGPVQVPSGDPTASQLAQANEVHERLLSRRGRDRAHHHRAEAARVFDGGDRRTDRMEYPQGPAFLERSPGFDG